MNRRAFLWYFNPRSHEGSDRNPAAVLWEAQNISIHAPTKGATEKFADWLEECTNFNPRSHEGSDHQKGMSIRNQQHNFNPRSHEGSDSQRQSMTLRKNNFNPRSHEGSDIPPFCLIAPSGISIHAPTKGATKRRSPILQISVFQSTLPRRERQILWTM